MLFNVPVSAQSSGIDHSLFPQLAGPFAQPQEVTAACLTCHAAAATEVMGTVHWTWEYTDPNTGQELGKNNVINNYCVAMPSNKPRCTSWHVGYGYRDSSFFETATEVDVDCLLCHSPDYGRTVVKDGEMVWLAPAEGVDVLAAAQNAQRPTNEMCLRCHQNSGGGPNFKHGVVPAPGLDVHTDAGLQCVDLSRW